MAGAPRQHGKKYEVRWYCEGRRWSLVEEFLNDARLASAYISDLGDRILPDDPRLVNRRYLVADKTPVVPGEATFREAMQGYMRTKTWSASRLRNFEAIMRNHYANWAEVPVSRLKDDHLNDKYYHLREATYLPSPRSAPKPYTRNSIINIMDQGLQVLSYAHRRGMMGDVPDPTKSPDLAFNRTMTRPRDRRPFREDEVQAILDLAEEHCVASGPRAVTATQHRDTMATLAVLGVRIGEVFALAVNDVDLVERVVWVGHTIERGMAGDRRKGNKSGEHLPPRPVAIDDDFCVFIKPYIEGRPGSAPLFPGVRDGKFQHPDEWRSRCWAPTVKLAVERGEIRDHIDLVPHVMRYSMTAWLRRHAPTRDVSDRLGHKMEKTTVHYMHEDLDAQRVAMSRGVPKGIYQRGLR